MFCPAVFVAITPVHADPFSRVPVDDINLPVVIIGTVEPTFKVIEVASYVIDKLPAKHFILEELK